eukprot:767470-Hanusia_phi.AAC.3
MIVLAFSIARQRCSPSRIARCSDLFVEVTNIELERFDAPESKTAISSSNRDRTRPVLLDSCPWCPSTAFPLLSA